MTQVNSRVRNLGTASARDAETLHQESLSLLERVGIRVQLSEARDLLAKAGARVTNDRVRIPPELVEIALSACSHSLTLRRVDGTEVRLVDGEMLHSTGCHRLAVLDHVTGETRSSTLEDARVLTRLANALKHIDAITLMVSARDLPFPASEIRALETLVAFTEKLLYLAPPDLLEAQTLLDMADIVARDGAAPSVLLFVSPTSPLTLAAEPTRILLEGVRRGAVLLLGSCASAGATSPVTLAGTLLQHNAETLAAIVLAQLAREGTPIIYDAASTIADLRSGVFSLGAVEYSLLTDALIPLVNRYELPVSTTCDTTSPFIDVQNGLQKMLGYFCMMGSGVNFSKNAGSLGNGTILSAEQMVIDSEIIAVAERFFAGIDVDTEHLAADVIEDVGPGGEYLTTRHTLEHCRSGEHFVSQLLNMQNAEAPSMRSRACARIEDLLAGECYCVSDARRRELAAYADEQISRQEKAAGSGHSP